MVNEDVLKITDKKRRNDKVEVPNDFILLFVKGLLHSREIDLQETSAWAAGKFDISFA